MKRKLDNFLNFIKKYYQNGAAVYQYRLRLHLTIASEIIWYNKHILFDKRSFYNTALVDKGINHLGQLFDTISAMKP